MDWIKKSRLHNGVLMAYSSFFLLFILGYNLPIHFTNLLNEKAWRVQIQKILTWWYMVKILQSSWVLHTPHLLLTKGWTAKITCQLPCKNILVVRVVSESVPVQVHGGPGTGTFKEKVELDPDPEPFRNRFLGSRTIYGTGLDPGPNLRKEQY